MAQKAKAARFSVKFAFFVCGLNLLLPFCRYISASNLPATLYLNLSFETG